MVGTLPVTDDNKAAKHIRKQLGTFPNKGSYNFPELFTEVDFINTTGSDPYTTEVTNNSPTSVLRKGQELIFAVMKKEGNKPYISSNGKVDDLSVHPKAKKFGGTFMVIPKPDGTFFPYNLWTKTLLDIPNLSTAVSDELDDLLHTKEDYNIAAIDANETITDIVPVNKGGSPFILTIKDGKIKVKNKGEDYTYNTGAEFVAEQAKNLYLQIDANKINTGTYNKDIEERVSTDLNPSVHFVNNVLHLKPLGTNSTEAKKPVANKKPVATKKKKKFKIAKGARKSTVNTEDYKVWDKKAELGWFAKKYSSTPIEVLEDTKYVSEFGKDSWGIFQSGIIYMKESAAEGTLYHEAFHAVMNMYLSSKHRAGVLSEASVLYNERANTMKGKEEIADLVLKMLTTTIG